MQRTKCIAKPASARTKVRIGVVEGDNLSAESSTVGPDTPEMFDTSSVFEKVEAADQINSLVAVDSAMALGHLIYEFDWGPDDFDLLAAGTLAGHLLECSAQVTGGTLTD